MVSIPYALSVSHFINTVGADAGFAAIIGLALLVLLFFAQMRETSHLRDQVADATDHVSHLEHRITQLTRSGAAPGSAAAPGVAPRPASVPATGPAPAIATAAPVASRAVAPASSRAAVLAPIAPAGVGAPALASATRLIPAFDDGPISVRQSGAAAATGLARPGVGAGAAAAAGGASAPGGGRSDAAVIDPPGPPPATPAGGANGSTTGRTPPPAGAGAPRTGQAGRPPAPRNGGRTGATAAPRRTDHGPEPRSRLRGLLGALIALGVVAAIVVVLLLLTGGSSSPTASSSSTSKASNAPTGHRRSHRTAAIKPSSVTVAVLNGTSTNNLAHDVSVKLGAATYRLGKIATATDQTHTSTVVAYLPGHRAAAQIVAKSLGLGAGVIAAADQSSQAVACPPGAPCTAQVIVTVGADLASVASSSTAAAAPAGTGTGAPAATSTG